MKDKLLQKVRSAYLSGLSTRQVAAKFKIGSTTVYTWCEDILRSKSESLSGEKHPGYKGGSISKEGYLIVRYKGKQVKHHRLIMGFPRGMIVHHINENKLDNRLENLRIMTLTEHLKLHKTGKPSKLKGTKKPPITEKTRRLMSMAQRKRYGGYSQIDYQE